MRCEIVAANRMPHSGVPALAFEPLTQGNLMLGELVTPINQRRAILWPGSFNLWSEGSQGLLGSFETHLARLDVVLVGGNGHDRAE